MDWQESIEEDIRLADEIRKGSSEAEACLCEKYRPKIFYFARTKAGYTAAEDICQDTITALLGAVRNGRIRNPEKLFSYVYQIYRNKLADYWRRTGKEMSLECVEKKIPSQAHQEEVDMEFRQALMEGWRELRLPDKRLLYLKYVKGMRYEEIAGILNMTVEVARKRAQRAKERIRSKLK